MLVALRTFRLPERMRATLRELQDALQSSVPSRHLHPTVQRTLRRGAV
jgi:hypothetical protein